MGVPQSIVIGGSIAGLLAARILSEHCDRVTVLDRDRLPLTPDPRRGVPQSVQPHVLFTQGYRILENLFPGIGQDLRTAGAVPIDWGQEFYYFNRGHWNATTDRESGLASFTCSRPLLESIIRQRVQNLDNVEWVEHCRVVGLVGDHTTRHISGVYVASPGDAQPQVLLAQLIVDASGRGTQAPHWLKTLGITPPPVTRIDAGLGYATRRYHIPPQTHTPWKVLLISQEAPQNRRLGYLAQMENQEWIATLGGYEHDYPPLDNSGFIDFAQSLAHPAFYKAIREAEPVSDIRAHRATANRLYHYEQIEMPAGFVALGDAVCALCPVYGQGMTVSALAAQVLHHWLLTSMQDDRPLNTTQFQKKLAHSNAFPWSVAIGQDTQFLSVQALAPASKPLDKWVQWYLSRLLTLTPNDAEMHVRFTAMAHMVSSPLSLFSPPVLWKALVNG